MQPTKQNPALDHFESACNAKRREMYGENWQSLNWYGQPLAPVYPKRIARVPGRKWPINEHSTLDRIGQGV